MKIKKTLVDMFIRIKNNSQNYKKSVEIIKTKPNIKLLKFLYDEGYISGYSFSNNKSKMFVYLKYQNSEPLIKNLNFILKPNKEIYCSVKTLSQHKNNNSFYVLYTQKGYKSIMDAKLQNLGGLLICRIN